MRKGQMATPMSVAQPKRRSRVVTILLVAVVVVGGLIIVGSLSEENNDAPTAQNTTRATTTTITSPTTTATRPTTTTTLSDAEIAQMAFEIMVLSHPVLSAYPMDLHHELALAVCESFDQGLSYEVAALTIYSASPADWDADTVGYLMGIAVGGYCPRHTPLVEEAADRWN